MIPTGRLFASAVLALVLVATAFGQMFFVMPRYRRFVEGAGVEPSLPARLAMSASRVGLLLIVASIACAVAAVVLERRGRRGAVAVYLTALSFVTAIYLACTAAAFWDLMRLVDRIQ